MFLFGCWIFWPVFGYFFVIRKFFQRKRKIIKPSNIVLNVSHFAFRTNIIFLIWFWRRSDSSSASHSQLDFLVLLVCYSLCFFPIFSLESHWFWNCLLVPWSFVGHSCQSSHHLDIILNSSVSGPVRKLIPSNIILWGIMSCPSEFFILINFIAFRILSWVMKLVLLMVSLMML